MNESVKRSRKRKPFDIPVNKLKVESIRFFEDEDTDGDATADYTPEDDVVLVIDPEMEETPESEEDAEAAAEELIGDCVCKCAICGANYVCDCESVNEDMESEEDTCPVCGETGEQIVVGTITPTEEISDEDEDELTDIEDDDFDDDTSSDDEDDDDFGESVQRAKNRTMNRRRTESKRVNHRPVRRTESNRTPSRKSSSKSVTKEFMFDEAVLNRMLTRFAKENYDNVKFVKISRGKVANGKLTLEGVVTTTRGNKRTIKFVSENFKPSSRMTLKFKEFGPFTESTKSKSTSFVVECVTRGKTITPMALKYNYKVQERKNMYQVSGKVMTESARPTSRKRK